MLRWNEPEWQEIMQEMFESVVDILPETYKELEQDEERRDQWVTFFSDLAEAYYCFEKECYDFKQDSILIRFGGVSEKYVHSAYLLTSKSTESLDMKVNSGMTNDSLVVSNDTLSINLGCHLSPNHLRYYRWNDDGKEVYLKNLGDDEITVETPHGVYHLMPRELIKLV